MGWKKGRIMKLTKKQFSEFKRVNNLRKQMLRKKGKFISPKLWENALVTDLESDDSHRDGGLIFIELIIAACLARNLISSSSSLFFIS